MGFNCPCVNMQLHFTVFLQLIVNSEVCEGFCLKCSSAELDSSSATNSAMVTPPWLTLSAKINHVPQELICMVNLVFHILLFLSTCITCFFVWEALELALVCYLATHMPDFLLCIKIGIKEKKRKNSAPSHTDYWHEIFPSYDRIQQSLHTEQLSILMLLYNRLCCTCKVEDLIVHACLDYLWPLVPYKRPSHPLLCALVP